MSDTFNWGRNRKDATTILEGEFPVVITVAEATKSSTGKQMVKYTVKLTSGPYAGRTVKGQFTFSPESPVATKIFYAQLQILGLGDAFFGQLSELSLEQGFARIATELQGKQATVILKNKPWNGQDKETIDGWKPLAGAPAAGGYAAQPAMAAAALASPLPAAVAQPVAAASGPPADPF